MEEVHVLERPDEPFYTVAGLAKRWVVSRRFVENEIESKQLPSYKFGRARRIKLEDVASYEAGRRDNRKAA